MRSERENFLEEGNGKRREREAISIEGEEVKALLLHGGETTYATSTKWRSDCAISDMRMLDYLNNICLIRCFITESLTHRIYPRPSSEEIPYTVSMLCTMRHPGHRTHLTGPSGCLSQGQSACRLS